MALAEILATAIAVFALGFGVGFLTGRMTDSRQQGIRTGVAVFIVAIWATSVVAGIALPEYETSIYIHAIMGGIVGYLFGIDHPFSAVLGGGESGDPAPADSDLEELQSRFDELSEQLDDVDQDQPRPQNQDRGGRQGGGGREP